MLYVCIHIYIYICMYIYIYIYTAQYYTAVPCPIDSIGGGAEPPWEKTITGMAASQPQNLWNSLSLCICVCRVVISLASHWGWIAPTASLLLRLLLLGCLADRHNRFPENPSTAVGAANPRGKSLHDWESWVKQIGGFPESGSSHPRNKNTLGSDLKTSRCYFVNWVSRESKVQSGFRSRLWGF